MAKTTRTYPVLSEMGVENPLLVDNYYITSLNQVDALRIIFDRRKESFFTSSRTYRFPRVPTTTTGDKKATSPLGTHPKLIALKAELEEILEAKSTKQNLVQNILREIELLEEDIAMRTECLRVLAGKIPEAD